MKVHLKVNMVMHVEDDAGGKTLDTFDEKTAPDEVKRRQFLSGPLSASLNGTRVVTNGVDAASVLHSVQGYLERAFQALGIDAKDGVAVVIEVTPPKQEPEVEPVPVDVKKPSNGVNGHP